MKNKNVQKSFSELSDSLRELMYFGNYIKEEMKKWKLKMEGTDSFYKVTKHQTQKRFNLLENEVITLLDTVESINKQISNKNNNSSLKVLEKCIEGIKIQFISARGILSGYASLVTFLNWQSPSLHSSKNSRIGIEKYEISWDFNDYKRDRSNDTMYLENQLEKKLLSTKGTGKKPVLRLFNCGMAAFTSIIYALWGEKIVKKKILLSADIYVEALLLLNKFFPNKLHTVKTNNTNKFVSEILTTKPDVVVLEPLSNTANIPLFDVEDIVKSVSKKYKETIYFIIDVTCFMGFENIFDNFKIPENIKIIMHGSILKSPQLGMERVNSGFVLSFGLEHFKNDILDYRTFSGTNMQDICANLFPVFSRAIVKKRQLRIQENTVKIAKHLKTLDSDNRIFEDVVYPGLEEHPDYDKSRKMGFAGPFMNIRFLPAFMTDKHFEYFSHNFVRWAEKLDVDVVHGASYGFNQTSIYYALGWEGYGDHYIRISVGTETSYELEKLQLVFTKVVEDFKKTFKV